MKYIKIFLDFIDSALLEIVSRLGPWIAPLPAAVFIFSAIREHLVMDAWAAGVAAAVIETLGLTTVHIGLRMFTWNNSKRKSDPEAPVWMAGMLGGVYIVATMILIIVLKVVPDLAQYAPAIFPLLSVAGVMALALTYQQKKREQDVADEKAEKAAAKEAKEADRQPPTANRQPPTAKTEDGATANLSATASAKLHQIRQLAEGGGWATDAELAGLMDWSETTARRYRSMAEDNSFIHRNGDGRYHLGGGAK